MPINVQDGLPAIKQLENEGIFVMPRNRAIHQEIRPLEISIVNLMPEKPTTEKQLLARLSNTPIQVNISLFRPKNHKCKTTPKNHLDTFYKTFDELLTQKYDGLIITGAPVEKLEFEDVDYWPELTKIMDWSKQNVFSVFHVCWAAQAGLYHHYGIGKHKLDAKCFGVYEHKVNDANNPLLRGFDDVFLAPHSRHTTIRRKEILPVKNLKILAESKKAGVYIIASKDLRQIFVTGHSEYDPLTLHYEYIRDIGKGLPISLPENYYPKNNPKKKPQVSWRAHSNALFTNWINIVYQGTPFNREDIL